MAIPKRTITTFIAAATFCGGVTGVAQADDINTVCGSARPASYGYHVKACITLGGIGTGLIKLTRHAEYWGGSTDVRMYDGVIEYPEGSTSSNGWWISYAGYPTGGLTRRGRDGTYSGVLDDGDYSTGLGGEGRYGYCYVTVAWFTDSGKYSYGATSNPICIP